MWLLEPSIKAKLEKAVENGLLPNADQQMLFESNRISGGDRITSYSKNVAQLSINGVLTKKPDFLAMLFGGGNTTYEELISAITQAEGDEEIESIELYISSPGGNFDGLIEAMDAVKSTKKPIKAIVKNMATSAAYGIASQADSIEAFNRGALVGSVGVAVQAYLDKNTVSITNEESPKKRPDLTTKEGVKTVQEELNAIHSIFAESIALGRGISVEKVNADFGQGATLLANDALKRGMIDSIADPQLSMVKNTNSTTASSGNNQEARVMDLKTLQAQHPDVYEAAVKLGVDQERDRVCAHLTMGEASGDIKTASEAIKEGSGMTATLQAKYMTAGMNRGDMQNRQGDEQELSGADNLGENNSSETNADKVVALVAEKMGLEA